MANSTDKLFMTLLAATSEASQALKYQNTFIESIFWKHKPVVAAPYTVLNVIVPTVNEANTVDIGSGPLQPHDLAHTSYPVPLNHNFSTSFKVGSWDQSLTPYDMRKEYIDAELEGFARKINRLIASLFTAANFPNYSIVGGAGADAWARADLSAMWANLANAGVPDMQRTHFVTSTLAYSNMLADSTFINQYIVGEGAAVQAQQKAKLSTQYGASVEYDQHLAKFSAGKEPGVLYHPYAVAGVKQAPVYLNAAGIKESSVDVFGIPTVVQMAPDIKDQGWIINYRAGFGVAPARTEMATLGQTA